MGAKAQVRVDERRPARSVHPQALATAIYLQLHGHPETALRPIEVRIRETDVELRGAVADDAERSTAERLAALVVADTPIVNRIHIQPSLARPRPSTTGARSTASTEQRLQMRLARAFPEDVMNRIHLTAIPVSLNSGQAADSTEYQPEGQAEPTDFVAVLEGTAPSVRDQFVMNDMLLNGPGAAVAVVNRLHVAAAPAGEPRPLFQLRAPFIGLDIDLDRGYLATPIGSLGVESGPPVAPYVPDDDRRLATGFMAAARADQELYDARLTCVVFARVLFIDGSLTPADKMRAVRLARGMEGVRAVVDRTETTTTNGGPAYHDERDLADYLDYRLGEHSSVWGIELEATSSSQIKVRATSPTPFHSTLATAVIARDSAIAPLPLDLSLTEWTR
jgi:osmotically-inducible protein OsmY